MGTSGAGLFADDTAMDVRLEWTDAFRTSQSAAKATERTLRRFRTQLNDADDGPIIRLALAVVQHKHGCLTATAKRDALEVISRGQGLDRWAEAGVKPLAKRRAVYADIATLLRSPQPAPRELKKPSKPRGHPFQPGDVVAVPISKTRTGYIKILAKDAAAQLAIIALLDLTTKPGRHPANWADQPLRWFRYKHTSGLYKGHVRGDPCWSMAFWGAREVPRDQMVVVGQAPVTAAERRMVMRYKGATAQWLSVPARVRDSFRLKDPDFRFTGLDLKRFVQKSRPIRPGEGPL